ncbi:prepilin-type N-terminal cleavage/methylation domain-containing protein [Clostridium sp. LQ25]|uniref:type II secretion system protein n=1 Tax=Clostridium sp. LQ25 TaxID=2992805 RepID=UPI00225270D4|nr:prepilin-type N-terminal cleavage/methylation domain-containing protein [Clostridium sp. LQ25]UZT07226.1 prepilin-type N-terminal cleavage/methylation domain-containing protein [Clostridium sp. LQ25]
MSKKKGFTVLELAIVVALTAVLLGIVGSMVTIASNMIRYSDNKSTLQKQAQIIQEKFSYIGMQAKEFNIINDYEYIIKTVNDDEYKIGFEKIQDDIYDDILVGDKSDMSNAESYMFNDSDKKNITITGVVVVKSSNKLVSISFNLEKGSHKNNVIYPVSITFYLRNN